MATTELKCERHHTPTHLACAQCGKPACPRCLVWTEVGQKCRTCVPGRSGSSRARMSQLVVVGSLVAALILAFAIAGGAFSGDSSSDDVPVSGNTGQRQAGIGQPARDGPLTFVVTAFRCPGKDLGEGPLRRTALGRYCVLDFRATNTSSRPASFSLPAQVLLDRQKRRFAPDPTATATLRRAAGSEGFPPVQQLNPGAEISSSLVYDVPEGITPELAELHAGRTLGVTVRISPGSA